MQKLLYMQPIDSNHSHQSQKTLPLVHEKHALSASALKAAAMTLGADDVGFVSLGHEMLDSDRADILRALPGAKTVIGLVQKMNPDAIREPGRSIANLEFHQTMHGVDEIARDITRHLRSLGVRAVNPSAGFPMEMDKFPGKLWVISHKKVAEAAGLGKMGIHRNVIHPQFGNFIFLGSVITDVDVDHESEPLDFNPCFECKLCVAACPTGAISPKGELNFSACYTHNYREFMGGFSDLTESIADSRDGLDLRRRITDAESASWWQSLSFGANYKAAYCMAVCPAGDDVIGPFKKDRKAFTQSVVRPLQQKEEVIYVTENADATSVVKKRFKNKTLKTVRNTLRPMSIEGFLGGMPLVFQPGRARGLSARYHFRFRRGKRITREATITIQGQRLSINPGIEGEADTRVDAQEEAWLGFLRKERSLLWQLLIFRIRVSGKLTLLQRFGECFAA